MLHKSLILLLLGILCSVVVPAQAWHSEMQRLEKEVFALLRAKDVGTVAAELARAPAPRETWPLLVRLNIYARAGHKARIQQTLEQLRDAPDMPPLGRRGVVAQIIRDSLPSDLALQRFYREHLVPDDKEDAEKFYLLWLQSGDTKGLDEWLARCGQPCLGQRVSWHVNQGTADNLLDQMATELATYPSDLARLESYSVALQNAVGYAQHVNKPLKISARTRWEQVLKAFAARGAADYYAQGELAAQRKDFDEAMRLWRLFSRYDRRLPHYLFNDLAATPAKAKLREFYLAMKQADPASTIPDEALARLGS